MIHIVAARCTGKVEPIFTVARIAPSFGLAESGRSGKFRILIGVTPKQLV